jgi:hypothetical protein
VEVRPIQSNLRFFSLSKKAHVFERACIVANKGANRPIFEGEMPPKKCTPKYNAASGIIAGELLIETKFFDGIWSFGEHSMGLYMGGRQIFETSHEVHKREDNKSNKQNNYG